MDGATQPQSSATRINLMRRFILFSPELEKRLAVLESYDLRPRENENLSVMLGYLMLQDVRRALTCI
jgi:hypothetical protein